MARYPAVVVLLLVLAAPVLAVNFGVTPEIKPAVPATPGDGVPRQGGDTMRDAYVISSLPFSDSGTTTGYAQDYTSSCGANSAPDVVYVYTSSSNMPNRISLCGSSYDTVLHVHEDAIGNEVGCNDDFCGLQSELGQINMTAGHTYFIVVTGYSSDSGDYTLDIWPVWPDPPCPFGFMPENEPACGDNYVDNFNGGCNSTPVVWQTVDASEGDCASLCGYTCTYLDGGVSTRDTDWFLSTGTGGTVTLSGTGEFAYMMVLMFGPDCSNLQYISVQGNPGVVSSLNYTIANGAPVGSFFAPATFSGVPNVRYWITICGIGDAATPSESMTWGAVKNTFR